MNENRSIDFAEKQQPGDDDCIGELVAEYRSGNVKRRDFLRRLVAIGISTSAAYSVLNQASAAGQVPTNMHGPGGGQQLGRPYPGSPTTTALINGRPEEDVPRPGTPPRGTTFARGEEDATSAMVGEESSPGATSTMVGEESYPQPTPQPTTYAVGEEGPNPPMGTTTMVGEESYPQPTPPSTTTLMQGEESYPQPTPQPTTYAVGEECNTPPPMSTTTMVGEESSPVPSTKAWGEEGLTPSTRRMGEEGSPGPPMNTTTLMFGEESQQPVPIPTSPTPSNLVPPNPVPGNSWNGFGRW